MTNTTPVVIHDRIKRRKGKFLYYSMKATSTGRKDKNGRLKVASWHIYISDKPPEEPDDCYFLPPLCLEYKNEICLEFNKGPSERKSCVFLDKERIRKRLR